MDTSPRQWLLLECLPVYLLPLLAILYLSLFGPFDFDLAIAQALTGTDFFAASFAFLYVFAIKRPMDLELKNQVYISLLFLLLIFVGVKAVPVSIPPKNECCADYKSVRMWFYVFMSLSSFFWTFSVVKKVYAHN